MSCPCDSGQIFERCCGPCLSGAALPETAVALMRSRYTAYVKRDTDYVAKTWASENRPSRIALDGRKWLGLKVRRTEAGLVSDTKGVVEFVARFKIAGKGHRLHEVSRFERRDGVWVYLDGEMLS